MLTLTYTTHSGISHYFLFKKIGVVTQYIELTSH